jgi:pheromone shutdown-related protein TraB
MIEEVAGAVIVGTAHVSATSVAHVEEAIRKHRPARVLVELDPARRKALEDPDAWQRTDLVKVIREGKQHLFLLQLYLAAMQAQMGRETGVAPGGEMLRAIKVAAEVGAEVVLIDRDVSVTLRRGFGAMGFWSRARLFWKVWMEVLTPAQSSERPASVDDLLKTDAITKMTEDFARFAPAIKVALIDERDDYMASHIRDAVVAGGGVVAVVGAGHVPGIRTRLIGQSAISPRSELEQPPPPRLTAGKVLGWGIPLLLVAGFVWIGYTADWDDLRDEIL